MVVAGVDTLTGAHIWNEWHSGGPLGGSQRLHAGS